MIGKTLKADLHTLDYRDEISGKVVRGRYARICVELDLQKRLIPRVILGAALFNVEYEGLDLICFSCGRYGHRRESCPWKKGEGEEKKEQQQGVAMEKTEPSMSPEKALPTEGEEFGPWMFVGGQKKARFPRREGGRNGAAGVRAGTRTGKSTNLGLNQSRFDVIADLEEEKELEKSLAEIKKGGSDLLEGSGRELVVLEDRINELNRRGQGVGSIGKSKGKGTQYQREIVPFRGKENVGPSKWAEVRRAQKDEDCDENSNMGRGKKGKGKSSNRVHQVVMGVHGLV